MPEVTLGLIIGLFVGGLIAIVFALRAVGGDADALGLTRLAIVNENVLQAIGVPRYQVRGPRRERHVPAISANRRMCTVVMICLRSA